MFNLRESLDEEIYSSCLFILTNIIIYFLLIMILAQNQQSSCKILYRWYTKRRKYAELKKSFSYYYKLDLEKICRRFNCVTFNGVVKYLKIYRNSMSDTQASSIYSIFNSSPYLSNISNGSNADKFNRRHDDVESYFTNNPSTNSFSITGNQLGLSNGSENYKVYKFGLCY